MENYRPYLLSLTYIKIFVTPDPFHYRLYHSEVHWPALSECSSSYQNCCSHRSICKSMNPINQWIDLFSFHMESAIKIYINGKVTNDLIFFSFVQSGFDDVLFKVIKQIWNPVFLWVCVLPWSTPPAPATAGRPPSAAAASSVSPPSGPGRRILCPENHSGFNRYFHFLRR